MRKVHDFEKDNAQTVDALKRAGLELELKEDFINNEKIKILSELDKKKKSSLFRLLPALATVLLLVFSLFVTTVLAFPGMAGKLVPKIPIMKEIAEKDTKIARLNEEVKMMQESDRVKLEEIELLKTEIEELKIRIKEISDEKIREVETSPNEDEAQNLQIQSLVVEFIKEMYRGNYEKAAGYCTEEFAHVVLSRPGDVIMRPLSDAVVFTQITNVAKVDDSHFLVFLRLNDSGDEMEADYQLDVEIIATEEGYFISFVGIDA